MNSKCGLLNNPKDEKCKDAVTRVCVDALQAKIFNDVRSPSLKEMQSSMNKSRFAASRGALDIPLPTSGDLMLDNDCEGLKMPLLEVTGVVSPEGKSFGLRPNLPSPRGSPSLAVPTIMTPPRRSPVQRDIMSGAAVKKQIWDQTADVLMRICLQVENLLSKKPNYYGVFNSEVIVHEILTILCPRCKLCIQEYVACNGGPYSNCPNSPMDEIVVLKDRIRKLSLNCTIRCSEITGRIFWERFLNNEQEVSWSKFSNAFQNAYGKQPARAMNQLSKALCIENVREKRRNLSEQSPTRKLARVVQSSPPTPGGNPDRIKFHAFSRDYKSKSNQSKQVVRCELFEKFCVDNGGLYEGFITVSDPATQVVCIGRIEEDSMYDRTFLLPRSITDLVGVKVLQVCCGGEHAAVLGEGGLVYTWGKGGFGRLGHGNGDACDSPRKVESLKNCRITRVRCGFAYTAAITSKGGLFSWGAGENGRLGVGDERDRFLPCRVLLPAHSKVKDVQAGSVHTCILTDRGRIYSCGKHEYTGHGEANDILVPKKVHCTTGKHSLEIVQISVGPGGYHTIALTKLGQVFTWGHNRVGQLGYCNSQFLPRNVKGAYFIPTPKKVTSLFEHDIVQVVAGWGHSAVLTRSGDLYTCGRNAQGQLGLGDPVGFKKNERGHPYLSTFTRVDTVPIAQISCGGEHSVAISTKGEVYTFGKGHHGQLGHGSNSENQNFPKRVESFAQDGRLTLQVACGNNCTLLLRGHFKVPSLFSLCREKIHSSIAKSDIPETVATIFEDLPE